MINAAVERHMQHVHNVAKLVGVNHEVRHEFNFGTSSRFCGYSAKMANRLAVLIAVQF